LDFPFNTSKITCTKRLRTCHEAYAHLPQPPSHSFLLNDGPIYGSERKTGSTYLYLRVDTRSYSIVTWDDSVITANFLRGGCSLETLTIRPKTKKVTFRDVPTPTCSQQVLESGQLNQVINAKLVDGLWAVNRFYDLKTKETSGYLMK